MIDYLTIIEPGCEDPAGGERVRLADCTPQRLAGALVYRTPDGRVLAPAFRGFAVDLGALDAGGRSPSPGVEDEDALADIVLDWVETVRDVDWSALRGAPLEGEDWVDLRAAMVRVGWGPAAAQAAWTACRNRPYARELPTAAGWAAAGWVVPAGPDEPDPAFARPVLEARGLQRWAYIVRWAGPDDLPDGPLPTQPEPTGVGWTSPLSRLRQDHYTEESLTAAADLAVGVLQRAGLGPLTAIEAEDEPLPDRDLDAACTHPSQIVRAAAWFLLHDEADAWLPCTYSECGHHWAVEAEEDAYELEEVLELAGYGVANPVDAAYQRRRLLETAFGNVSDVPLAGAGDVADFVAFYQAWVAGGRSETEFTQAAAELRGDDAT